jgi:hypothetical protein
VKSRVKRKYKIGVLNVKRDELEKIEKKRVKKDEWKKENKGVTYTC